MKSMTGFGRSLFTVSSTQTLYNLEISAVNRKFLDLSIGLPGDLAFAESPIRQLIAQHVKRGNLKVRIEPNINTGNAEKVHINFHALESILSTLPEVQKRVANVPNVNPQITLGELLRIEGIVSANPEKNINQEEAEREILVAVKQALDAFNAMRDTEGNTLKRDFLERLAVLESILSEIRTQLTMINDTLRARIIERIQALQIDTPLDAGRLEQEIFFLAQKSDVTEECVRLESHIAQFKTIVNEANCGRKLDFLVQEMQREITTLGNKTGHVPVFNHIVDFKTEIDRMKEQVQNVE